MLPDFRVPIVLGGETHHLLVQDVPACVFWQGYPDLHSENPLREKVQAEAEWYRHLLVRVTRKPQLDREFVMTWGEAYELPRDRYLEAIGFNPKTVLQPVEPGRLLEIDPVEPQALAEHAAFRGCVPPAHVQGIVRLMARTVGVAAAQLWLMPSSEFFFTYHVHLTDEEKAGAPLPEVVRA